MLIRKIKVIVLLVLLGSCSSSRTILFPSIAVTPSKKTKLSEEELNNWQHKDIYIDTIPGISSEKAYRELLKKKAGQTIIVAVLDTGIDIEHEDLEDNIWTNPGEIPGNGIDDDRNGYIDDIHGWNFLGSTKGENVRYVNYEAVRIIRKYEGKFKGKSENDVSIEQRDIFLEYQRAKKSYEEQIKTAVDNEKYAKFLVDTYPKSREALKKIFPNEDYTIEQLDSLYTLYKEDKELSSLIYYMSDYMKYNLSQEWIKNYKEQADAIKNLCLDFGYNDKDIIGDDPENIKDNHYGNNNIIGFKEKEAHGTAITGTIAAIRDNNIGIDGVANNVKIMPIRVVPKGDEYDKDVALGIRYAVDNGAKIINMSFGKQFSMHQEWVLEALKYAAKKNVLVISAAGNDGMNIDENHFYPNDQEDNTMKEIADNFLKVGAITYHLDEKLVAYFSNYGKTNVDVFAPGYQIYAPLPKNKYKAENGTSIATPLASGVAALIWSYYPNLSASQIKKIIMESGISYNIECNIPGTKGKEKQPFSEFSKSGKVINAYNALLMAEKMSKNKM